MLAIDGDLIGLTCDESGAGLSLVDRRRRTRWVIDDQTVVFGNSRMEAHEVAVPIGARLLADDTLAVTYDAGGIKIEYEYQVVGDFVEVRLLVPEVSDGLRIALPGSFAPDGERSKLILPIMQGMLWDGRGEPVSIVCKEAVHRGFSMPLIGYLAERGGLLFTAETRDDLLWWYGKDSTGRKWATSIQTPSLGSLRYPRIGRLYLTEPSINAIAKTYRRKVIAQGRFLSWEEKIAQRPGLERLFGALMCFIGYCRDDEVDYVTGCARLKQYGFDRALVYPARFNIYKDGILMGGEPAISLTTDEVEAIRALGYDVAPWTWINEALDDGSEKVRRMYRRGPDGEIIPHWAIDDQQWYLVCSTFMEEYQKQAVRTKIADCTWDHFDVLACNTVGECYALDHPNHLGRPIPRSNDREWVRKALLAGQADGRAVSSENFNDAYSLECDLMSVKALPRYGSAPFWPIPLTMLVYHDSIIHSWWEMHSYNNHWRGANRWPHFFEYGGGEPRLQSALDALMGCPPDVFPFGSQYGYAGRGRETFVFKYRFDDPEVQVALAHALPVARLHRRIGKQEMVHFDFLSDDGYVQETAFADGTRVVANFSRDVYGNTPGFGYLLTRGVDCIQGERWKVTD
ncbi:MAG: hypothetical protein GXX08_12585 [Firmicutes bacterium]|nr:hypothetical protein [Bacillota bacterium]